MCFLFLIKDMNFISKVFIISFLLLASGNLLAKHIVGGVMSYQCLGNNNYRFTLKVYRDCDPKAGGAGFDAPATLGVYKCGNTINCTSLTQKSAFKKPNIDFGDKANILPPVYPCLKVPPVVCVEEAIYEFTLNLPLSENSYHVVYQRCCRNNTITNIIDPQDSGATYEIELTPEAQKVCNNSPVFDNFPPTLICINEPLKFDHSASDADGDQLVYELCAPLLGGGKAQGNNQVNGCNGVSPSPACPPPFDFVNFQIPNFTYDKPLGASSVISIDPVTGQLTVNPKQLGQFVVGICVTEYRNGVKLSTVRRDFQFNVANCEPLVNASLKNDKVLGNQQFVLNICGENTLKFKNESTPSSNIFSYDWYFEGASPQESKEKDATITFPGYGTYKGTMIINKGTTCADTATIYVNVFPDLKADFSFDYDTCKAEPVKFVDKSYSEAGKIENWYWDFQDGSLSSETNPAHLFKDAGNYPVKLRVFDLNGCSDSITKNVSYFPVPPVVVVKPSRFVGCIPAKIKFDNQSHPIDNTYNVEWDFGDGTTGKAISPTHTYTEPGVYDVAIEITSPIGCKTGSVFNKLIKIEPSPEAGFSYSPSEPSNINPQVAFTDESKLATSWYWDFGDGRTTYIQNPIHTYQDTGVYTVTQIVKHPSGCLDTLIRILDVKPVVTFFLPNAFSPNGDGLNDVYQGQGIFHGIEDFEMTVWNRWGAIIYTSNDPSAGWDGRVNNEGNFVQNGVYVVKVRYKEPRGKEIQLNGFATVIK